MWCEYSCHICAYFWCIIFKNNNATCLQTSWPCGKRPNDAIPRGPSSGAAMPPMKVSLETQHSANNSSSVTCLLQRVFVRKPELLYWAEHSATRKTVFLSYCCSLKVRVCGWRMIGCPSSTLGKLVSSLISVFGRYLPFSPSHHAPRNSQNLMNDSLYCWGSDDYLERKTHRRTFQATACIFSLRWSG